ncbi:MAG: 50S ribosomal protein L9 [Rhodobacteraceae bacterium]|nr:50S ribosomal protein L9 [Paracoccaceae bacterium]MCY4137574.1 50S ribosomal protein L9 [Paracoccaceae bacterium]
MDVILLERVPKLGQMGDVVSVKKGFARNFLLPLGKALRATDSNIRYFESERARIEARNLDAIKEARNVAEKLDQRQFVVIRSASDTGSLYGSVTSRNVAEVAVGAGVEVDRRQCVLDRPIKELGMHEVSVVLHPDVSCTIVLNVARSEEEADLQATGKDILEIESEAELEADAEISDQLAEAGAAVDEDSPDAENE